MIKKLICIEKTICFNHSGDAWWNKIRKKIGTQDYVEIKSDSGNIMRGKGLIADETFSSWTFDSVSGELKNYDEIY